MDIITTTVSGRGPAERGAEIGSRFAAEIRECVAGYLGFFEIRGVDQDRVREIALSCFAALDAWAPNLAAELSATAEAASVPLWQLAALNARTEVLAVVAPDTEGECSTAVFAPSGAGLPETIQTWDWHAHLCRVGLIMSYVPDVPERSGDVAEAQRRVGRVTMFTELGVLGKIGVNDAGIGVHFNILHHASDRGVNGVPVHAIARRVLDEATTVDEAEAIIASAPASASTVLTVVAAADAEHRAACFEISPERVAAVRPDADGWLVHTNNFIAESQLPGEATRDKSTTYVRLAHVRAQRERMAGQPMERRAAGMCGADGAEAPVCFRPDAAEPLHEQWTTLLTVGFDLADGVLEYFPGAPSVMAQEGARRFG
ncbi:C45 family autoproteolytic acyltransferase/hydolase [Leucobacter japonicus]|uniref:C45 family autoproteolytic acyltransferase/hydolase n=1 Tax=Leucobacter japonicus TaxID=1461259 RepID=UPI0006A77933|nr:C45 family peptidase [Leucobacter japonicus]